MPSPHEQTPAEELEVFCAQDWLGPQNTRSIIHIGRNRLLETVRQTIGNLEPFLAANGGFCFFRTYLEDQEHSILLTNRSDIAGERSTVVSVNVRRPTNEHEPCFLGGEALQLVDLAIAPNSRWLNWAHEPLYRDVSDSAWKTPDYATRLILRDNTLKLVGNIAAQDFAPFPAPDLATVERDADVLWDIQSALRLCNTVSFEEHVSVCEI